MTDVIALYILRNGQYYKEKKYQKVSKEDEENLTLKALNHSQDQEKVHKNDSTAL